MKKKIIVFLITTFVSVSSFTFNAKAANEPEITATAAALIDADTGLLIYGKNIDEKRYPASITKIMTAILAIEEFEDDMERRIPFSKEAIASLPWDSSNMGMKDGESLTLSDALYGLMLPSANEVANALAQSVSGNINDFTKLMTKRAAELGATNTNFANPHGLHEPQHYTTAGDMAKIMMGAVKLPKFVEVISAKKRLIPATEKRTSPFEIVNTNKLIQPGNYFYEYAIGGKTGFTDEAGHTLVTYAEKDGHRLISVVLQDVKNVLYTDTIVLLKYGFSLYNPFSLVKAADFTGRVEKFGNLKVSIKEDIKMDLPLPKDSVFRSEIIVSEGVSLPISVDENIGVLRFYADDLEVCDIPVYAAEERLITPLTTDFFEKKSQSYAQNTRANDIVTDEKNVVPLVRMGMFILLVPSVLTLIIVCIRHINIARRRRRYARIYYRRNHRFNS